MAEISFYQLKRQSVEQALLRLLEKALAGGGRAVVRVGSEEEMEALDNALWALDPDSFLPHGTIKAKSPADQPVLLTTETDAPNNASFAFVLPGAATGGLEAFERAFVIFDGAREGQLKEARALWKALQGTGAALAFWAQTEAGAWDKQAL